MNIIRKIIAPLASLFLLGAMRADAMAKPVLLIVPANGYQPTEYMHARQALEQMGHTVVIASNSMDAIGQPTNVLRNGARGMASTPTEQMFAHTDVDLTLEEIVPTDFSGIFFIGGPLSLQHLENDFTAPQSYRIAQQSVQGNVPLGAISFTPRILVRSGVLNGDVGTGYPGNEPNRQDPAQFMISNPQEMPQTGYTGPMAQDVFVENNVAYADAPAEGFVFANTGAIVTSVDRNTAPEFGAAIATLVDLALQTAR